MTVFSVYLFPFVYVFVGSGHGSGSYYVEQYAEKVVDFSVPFFVVGVGESSFTLNFFNILF